MIHDYNGLAKQYQEMYRRFGVAEHVVRKDGVWHCWLDAGTKGRRPHS